MTGQPRQSRRPRQPVVLDCDTGTDDAVAILLAALHPDLDLLGVTTVWGNHDVARTTENTLRVLDAVGRGDVGVHPGRDEPFRPRIEAIPSGRADLPPTLPLPDPVSTAGEEAVEWLVGTLRAAATPVALVATGPLTNLAAALAADRSITGSVGRLVVLGGTHRQTGVTPYAERNTWCDPEAAADVLAAPFRDVWLVTMDATCSAPLTRADAARLRGLGTAAGRVAADLVEERVAWHRRAGVEVAGGRAPVHDPLAVAALVAPDLLTTLRASVEVERRDPVRYGATRFTAEPDERRGRLRVAVRADHDRYVDLLCDTLAP
ncbi:purine nucleosidase/pyrimidine-specific ribonucleoside hydrolase/ribosylpyrimidine nucleosidase [Nocardioides sp. J9]|uniref:nucleoside hydrolase n=1 Tax=Nocardioides sp. J9 TaxID=935844 RepID=UPI0011A1052F|nr:nucleoside hydrolase [Nocardioides sp. J9]TWH01605.1 purine nucleosidase/pyrimidine-specific ribonucleoside hydrolase/ribosylpyrimidine nucleosidase [Nocardioides sp. J9]